MKVFTSHIYPFSMVHHEDEIRFVAKDLPLNADELWEIGLPGEVLEQALAEYKRIKEHQERAKNQSEPH